MYERSGKNVLAYKNSGEVLSKLKDIGYQATSLSTYDFSTLYTTLPHILIKKPSSFKRSFYKKEGKLYLACNDKKAFFTSADRGRTGLVVRASDSGSGDPGSILGRVGVLFP